MTDDQNRLINEFEARVRQLIFRCKDLQEENETLKAGFMEQKLSLEALSEEYRILQNKYDNLKIARIISVRQDDFIGAKKRLSKLVREVNKCIALLNE